MRESDEKKVVRKNIIRTYREKVVREREYNKKVERKSIIRK